MQGYNGARAAIEHASRRVVQGRLCITSRSNGSDRRREQRRLCIATAAQRQRPSMHRDSESNADCGEAMATTEHPASDQRDGEHGRLCFATTKQRQRPSIDRDGETMQGYNGALVAATEHHRDSERSAEYVEQWQGAEYVEQRQQQSMHRDGSRADFALLRQSNGSVISCITTARAALVSHGQPSFSSHIMFNLFLCEHTLSFSNGSCH